MLADDKDSEFPHYGSGCSWKPQSLTFRSRYQCQKFKEDANIERDVFVWSWSERLGRVGANF